MSEFSDKIGGIGRIRNIGTPRLTTRGRVTTISFTGENGSKTLKGSEVRSALQLRSTRFTISIDERANQVRVAGFGFGHGVGMSQWGARTLAEKGWSFDQILQHYYQSTAIAQLEN